MTDADKEFLKSLCDECNDLPTNKDKRYYLTHLDRKSNLRLLKLICLNFRTFYYSSKCDSLLKDYKKNE